MATTKRTVKKRRTPAQIRATKKLVALNKRNRRAKRTVTPKVRRTVKRRSPVKKAVLKKNPSRRSYFAGIVKAGKKYYFAGDGYNTDKKVGVKFASVPRAKGFAKGKVNVDMAKKHGAEATFHE